MMTHQQQWEECTNTQLERTIGDVSPMCKLNNINELLQSGMYFTAFEGVYFFFKSKCPLTIHQKYHKIEKNKRKDMMLNEHMA